MELAESGRKTEPNRTEPSRDTSEGRRPNLVAPENMCFRPEPNRAEPTGNDAFARCSGIVDLHLPDALHTISRRAFQECCGIVALHLPDALRSIGDGAFEECSALATLVLPAGCTSVGQGDGWCSRGAFHGCASLDRVLAPDALARGEAGDPSKVFAGCPVLLAGAGLTPHSAVRPLRRTLWHPTMHAWCTHRQRECVLTVLVAELRLYRQDEETAPLPLLVYELWLLILQFVPRHALGRP